MTSPDASAFPLPGGPARRPSPREHLAELLEARRRRVQTIRRWVVTLTVALFLTVQVVIFRSTALSTASTHAKVSSSQTSSGAVSTRTSGSAATSNPAATSTGSVSSPISTGQS